MAAKPHAVTAEARSSQRPTLCTRWSSLEPWPIVLGRSFIRHPASIRFLHVWRSLCTAAGLDVAQRLLGKQVDGHSECCWDLFGSLGVPACAVVMECSLKELAHGLLLQPNGHPPAVSKTWNLVGKCPSILHCLSSARFGWKKKKACLLGGRSDCPITLVRPTTPSR